MSDTAQGALVCRLHAKLWVILCTPLRGDAAFLFLASIPGNKADCAGPTLDGQLSRAGSDGAVRLEEGVIGMLRKLSRKARGIHHGPF
jgi:hypothetical protein